VPRPHDAPAARQVRLAQPQAGPELPSPQNLPPGAQQAPLLAGEIPA
jgi:hypothetical protein